MFHRMTHRLIASGILFVLLTASGCMEARESETTVDECSTSTDQFSTSMDNTVPRNPEDVRPILPGMSAPAFALTAADGTTYSFAPDRMERPVILTFYRGGWCPYCNRYLSRLRKIEPDLVALGYDLLFVSADRPEGLKESLRDSTLDYTLLADNDLVAARSYGLAFHVNDEMVDRYMKAGLDIEAASGRKHHLLPVPAVFIIDRAGVVRFQYANPDYKVRVEPELLLTAARLAQEDDR